VSGVVRTRTWEVISPIASASGSSRRALSWSTKSLIIVSRPGASPGMAPVTAASSSSSRLARMAVGWRQGAQSRALLMHILRVVVAAGAAALE